MTSRRSFGALLILAGLHAACRRAPNERDWVVAHAAEIRSRLALVLQAHAALASAPSQDVAFAPLAPSQFAIVSVEDFDTLRPEVPSSWSPVETPAFGRPPIDSELAFLVETLRRIAASRPSYNRDAVALAERRWQFLQTLTHVAVVQPIEIPDVRVNHSTLWVGRVLLWDVAAQRWSGCKTIRVNHEGVWESSGLVSAGVYEVGSRYNSDGFAARRFTRELGTAVRRALTTQESSFSLPSRGELGVAAPQRPLFVPPPREVIRRRRR
ncbi:MAG: hypothetical protein JNK05_30535 [Myxococcales bacterium]|nr:hypothetical protein [Myxococcales bacterium]